MEIEFEDKGLKADYEEPDGLEKKYGLRRAVLIRLRIQTLISVDSIDKLWLLPGHFHPLRENRSGEWACNLDQPYRLIFRYEPKDKVVIIEIVDYHKK